MRTESKTQRIVARVGGIAALMAALPAFAEEHAGSAGGPFEGNFGVALWTLIIFGIVVFLLPFVVVVIELVWPLVTKAYVSGEMSSNAGGLIRWPVFALVPIGFALLGLQGVSEFIKRLAFLQGLIDDPTKKKVAKTAEEELADAIRQQAERAAR